MKETAMAESPHDLARRLADQADAVCRHYLSSGKRQGNYWLVGDVRNTPGRSMFVRLKDSAKRPAGKWAEYVAAGVMLRSRDWALSHGRWTASTQHNLSTREVS
ncbi:hypothetical protein ACSBOB_33550 [Mesorhizobium sp. ASY16-5R]|uniref:hypothetical protein n=1 Tax=Mesorhizobium sp. ASY16-5R TaxID=3445772 RepID=UPI003FA068B2